MIKFSIILGVLGLLGTAAAMPYLGGWVSNWGPRQQWLVGLIAIFPAWLIAFLGLLPSSVGPEYDPLPRSALLSSVVALLGVVFTDTTLRRLGKSGYSLSPFKYWILGTTGLLPAWLITLWILFSA
jgi:hypothetical protein